MLLLVPVYGAGSLVMAVRSLGWAVGRVLALRGARSTLYAHAPTTGDDPAAATTDHDQDDDDRLPAARRGQQVVIRLLQETVAPAEPSTGWPWWRWPAWRDRPPGWPA